MNKIEQLPSRIKFIWLIHVFGNLFLLTIVMILLEFAVHFWKLADWLIYPALVAAVLIISFELLSIPYRYRFWQYKISNDSVEIQSGFIFRERVAIPIARVQNVTLSAGPVLQWQKLEKVIVATASSSHKIDGLKDDTAKQLRDQIMRLALEARDE
ncbi:PH domain-containing protein [Oenococcus sp. UCMA 16435]|nr:PH domain-containing protein [Oenococcus sp. UCMA 16435]MDN6967895.1 hypothetical protein [Oenococcus sp. UCMA 17063]